MLCLSQDIGAVVDAVEVNRLALIVYPRPVRRRVQPDHRGHGGPAVDVRHHLVVLRAGRNVPGPPHQAGHSPAAFKRRSLFATEGRSASVRVRILPSTVVGRHDNYRVRCLRANRIHDPTYVVIELQQRIGVIAEARLPRELRRRIGRVVHLHEVDIHEERLVVLGVLLDVVDRKVGLPDVECGKVVVGY